jgi:hypothetical protein
MKTLNDDALLVVIAAENITKGIALDDTDRQLLSDAAPRIRTAWGLV